MRSLQSYKDPHTKIFTQRSSQNESYKDLHKEPYEVQLLVDTNADKRATAPRRRPHELSLIH